MPRAQAVERVPVTEFTRTYPGHPVQVQHVRRDARAALAGHPSAEDIIVLASELATNAIVHSPSLGTTFEIRLQICPAYVRIECTDRGGDWADTPPGDHGRGLVLVETLAGGPGNWGTERTGSGQRTVWATVEAAR